MTILAAMLAAAPGSLGAQSLTAGAIVGTVKDTAGVSLSGVRVEVSDAVSGFARDQITGRDGRYVFRFLPPGEYVVLAEALGYRPVEIHGLLVVAGAELDTEAQLERVEPPVMDRTITTARSQALVGPAGPLAWTLGQLELSRLPDERRDLASAARFTTWADPDLVIEGLPGRLAGLMIEAVPFRLIGHPVSGQPDAPTLAFPVSGVTLASVRAGDFDVEWGGFAGGWLDAVERRGGSRLDVRLFGDWGGAPLTRSRYYAPEDLSGNSVRAGFQVGGPIIRDTAHFIINLEAQRLQTPYPRPWEPTSLDTALAGAAADSFGVDLGPRLAPSVAELKAVAGSGRFDWQPSLGNRLSVVAHGALLEETDPPLGISRFSSFGTEATGADLAAAASLTSVISSAFALELRASVQFNRREFRASDTALTVVPGGPVALGTDPSFAGDFRHTGFRLVETVHLAFGRHRIKLGGGGGIRSMRTEYLSGRGGAFVFGDEDRLGAADGAFSQVVGRAPLARFTGVEAGGFLQDRWHIAPGLSLLGGVRVDWEKIPFDKIAPNAEWIARTTLRNDSIDGIQIKVGPRGGFSWDVGNQHRWVVHGGGGVFHGVVDPDAFAEAIATANGVERRLGLGSLGRWPVPPDSAAAPLQGPTFAVVHPTVSSPRTSRAMFGLSGVLGGGAVLHLSTSYRHTDFLVRRHDLNLLPVPAARDQYGRPIYGTLRQSGTALVAEPGSNRRFADFDQVTALDQDGYSDYTGFTARIERRFGRLAVSTAYTYSRTEDNWLEARGGAGQRLTPFPDSLDGRDWTDGRSDFDIPHQFMVGAGLDFGAARLAAFYSFRSGYPFTPGFRDGVDANADGSWRNDPAYVDDQVAGVADLFAEWPCLLEQVGAFAARNSCRGPAVRRLDLRLALGPFRLGYPLEIVIDAMNLLDAEYADVDRALYLVDPDGAVTADPTTGVTTVPLEANPDFGRAVRRFGSGRALRLGIRVNYE